MRCSYCNWNNPEGLDRCQKCNKPIEPESKKVLSAESSAQSEDWKTRETRQIIHTCQVCSYPISPDDENCPNCNAALKNTKPSVNRATVLDVNFAEQPNRCTVREQKSRTTVLDSSASQKIAYDSCPPQKDVDTNVTTRLPSLFPVEIDLPSGEDIVLRRGDIVSIDGKKYLLR